MRRETIEVWQLQDHETGEPWMTPNGKHSWSGAGSAKNAWNCHAGQWLPRGSQKFDEAVEQGLINLAAVKIAEYRKVTY